MTHLAYVDLSNLFIEGQKVSVMTRMVAFNTSVPNAANWTAMVCRSFVQPPQILFSTLATVSAL